MYTRAGCVLTSLALVIALFSGAACGDSNGDILKIQVLTVNDSDYKDYTDNTWFSHHFANVPSRISGHLRQVVPRNACGYIELLNSTTESWFALVSDYPSCSESMVVNVRNAGYKLLITSSDGDSHRDVYKSLRNTNFPIVIVKAYYAKYLERHALSNSSSDPVTLRITTDDSTPITVITVVSFFAVFCCCGVCCCVCVCCCVYHRDDTIERRLNHLQRERRDLERQQQRHERLARQELIQSILRQLQELQLDLRQQVPLGRAETERLPTRTYKPGIDCETCAICVDDFTADYVVRVLPCGHAFHPQCIDEWLISHSSLCPLCKMELPRQQEQGQQDQLDESDNSDHPLLARRRSDSPIYGSI